MISDLLSLTSILHQLESTLLIEYSDELDAATITTKAVQRIERTYQFKLEGTLYELQNTNMLTSTAVETLLGSIVECLKVLSLYTSVTMFQRSISISLASVNYLGMSKVELKTALKYLQDEKLYENRIKVIPALKQNVSNIETTTIKRLFIILFILDALGVYDGVSVVAQLLYLGSIVS